ncbi:hypothetical protein TYRP_008984 [Tyrophagus putrescentiae]|nr:hypothetical protein TYRP_008984 [Tyrophagus putrescentiae]
MFLQTSKGKRLLDHEGYLYYCEREGRASSGRKDIFRCPKYFDPDVRCKGRAHVEGGTTVTVTAPHSHPPDPAKGEAIRVSNRLREKATTSSPETPAAHLVLAEVEEGQVNLLKLPKKNAFTTTGNQFVVFHSDTASNSPDRFLGLSTERGLQLLERADVWRGTLSLLPIIASASSSPSLFLALFTLHAHHLFFNEDSETAESSLPLVYVLLSNTAENTFMKMFTKLKQLRPSNFESPKRKLVLDFESTALSAFGKVFPSASLSGCFHQFRQSLWRALKQQPGLAELYLSDLTFSFKVHLLLALAFVPPADVVRAYDHLLNVENSLFQNENRMEGLLTFFEATYIGVLHSTGAASTRRSPQFEVRFWNQVDSVQNELISLTNDDDAAAERAHNAVNKVVANKAQSSSVRKLIDVLKGQLLVNESQVEQALCIDDDDQPLKKKKMKKNKRKKYKDNHSAELKGLLSAYDFAKIDCFLETVAHKLIRLLHGPCKLVLRSVAPAGAATSGPPSKRAVLEARPGVPEGEQRPTGHPGDLAPVADELHQAPSGRAAPPAGGRTGESRASRGGTRAGRPPPPATSAWFGAPAPRRPRPGRREFGQPGQLGPELGQLEPELERRQELEDLEQRQQLASAQRVLGCEQIELESEEREPQPERWELAPERRFQLDRSDSQGILALRT